MEKQWDSNRLHNKPIYRIWFTLLLVMLCYYVGPLAVQASNKQAWVTQEIRYVLPQAKSAHIVWGVNGWKPLPLLHRPFGTYTRDYLMHTPMKRGTAYFSVKIKLRPGTKLNYVFLIRNRWDWIHWTEKWDNGPESTKYQTVVKANGGITTIQGKPGAFIKKEVLVEMGLGALAAVLLLCLLGYGFVFVKGLGMKPQHSQVYIRFGGVALSSAFFHLLSRSEVLAMRWNSKVLKLLPQLLVAGLYDMLVVGSVLVAFIIPAYLYRHKPRWQGRIFGFYVLVAVLVWITALLNTVVVPLLGKPFNYQWLYYADFLQSSDAMSAMSAHASWPLVFNILAFIAAMLALAYALTHVGYGLTQYLNKPVMAGLGLLVCLLYFTWAYLKVGEQKYGYNYLSNPITAFAESMYADKEVPSLFTMEVPIRYKQEFGIPTQQPQNQSAKQPTPTAMQAVPVAWQQKQVRNVVVFVMESVSARYMQIYGAPYANTPNLHKYRQQAMQFAHAYAHVPSTNNSMSSMLCSIYPWISYRSLTQEMPAFKHPSLSSVLKQHGYRTAFFGAADNRFQQTGAFLTHRQFDVVTDYRSKHCSNRQFIVKEDRWEFADGADDMCTVDNFNDWINQRTEQPFMAMLWTVQTHYPYFLTEKPRDFGVGDPNFNRYLNALQHADAAFGKLMQVLESKGLAEHTLVVVVGDHGETFGTHQQTGHASGIYEENVHVPLLFINPVLFKGQTSDVPGGHVDIAPTVLDLLHLPAPAAWQGQSLFGERRSKRVYFFAPFSDFLFGYRDGRHKFIYNATLDRNELYDLETDHAEARNLSDKHPDKVAEGHKRLAAWVQFNKAFIAQVKK